MTHPSTRIMAAASALALLAACEAGMRGPADSPDPFGPEVGSEDSSFDQMRPVGAPYDVLPGED